MISKKLYSELDHLGLDIRISYTIICERSIVHKHPNDFPTDIYLLTIKGKHVSTRCEICSKLTIKRVEKLL